MSWLQRFRLTLLPARHHRDIDREIAFHIAERIEQLCAGGLSFDEARLAAHRQFGNALRIREDAHDMNRIGWLERLAQDAAVTQRMIRRSPGFVTAAVVTLAL